MPKVQYLGSGDLVKGQIDKPPFADLEGWDFQPDKGFSYWIFCSYSHTALQILHRLPASARSCRMFGTLPDGRDAVTYSKVALVQRHKQTLQVCLC